MSRSPSCPTRTLLLAISLVTGGATLSAQEAEHSALLAGDPNRIYVVGESGTAVANTRLVDALAGTSAIADAFSFGRDFGHDRIGHSYFLWSVVPPGASKGSLKGTPHFLEHPGETAADILWTADIVFKDPDFILPHGKASDENDASNVPVSFPPSPLFPIARSLGLGGVMGSPTGSDDIVGYDAWAPGSLGFEDDLYFSIDRVVTIPCPGTPLTVGPGDILRLPGTAPATPCSIEVFHAASDLGLDPGDDIDALAINRTGSAVIDGALVSGVVEPTGWYSVTATSPSVTGSERTGADLFRFALGVVQPDLESQLHITCGGLALCASDIVEDIDSLGHIDPQDVHVFCHRPELLVLPNGEIEGFLGAEVVPGAPFAFGAAFGPFAGSYAAAVAGQPNPQGALAGIDDPSLIGIVPDDPGGTHLVEFAGVRGTRFLVDRKFLVFPPDPGAPPPVIGLTATVDPTSGDVTVDWAPPGGTAGSLLFVNDQPPQPTTPPVTLGGLPPGAVTLEVRPFSGTPTTGAVGEGRVTVVFIESPVAPPRAVEWIENPGGPPQLTWLDPPQGNAIEIFLDGQPLANVPVGNGSFPLVLAPGLHFIALRTQAPQGVSVATTIEVFVPIENPPALPPRPHVEFVANALPVAIPAGSGPSTPSVTSIAIEVPPPAGGVDDVEARVSLAHPQLEGVRISLVSPAGTAISLVEPLGASGDLLLRHFDDLSLATPNDQGGDDLPDDLIAGGLGFATFDGEPAAGTWIIEVENFVLVGGTVDDAALLVVTAAEAQFRRADANGDGVRNIADAIFQLGVLFPPAGSTMILPCDDAGDANDDALFDIADPIFTLSTLFPTSGVPPTLPAPGDVCGPDPTADGLGCASSPGCP